jgi:hypothetical protein
MPALANPRWEAFAQALFIGLAGKTKHERAASTAYLVAYPSCSPGPAADANASRLLRYAKAISERVRELQAEQTAKTQRKVDISRERIARRLDRASEIAEAQDNAQGMVAAEMGIAKVFGHARDETQAAPSFQEAQSMQDIGRKLLMSVGLQEPDDVSINEAIEAKDAFISRLETIRDRAKQTIDS